MDKMISALLVFANKFCTKNANAEWSLQLCYLKYPRNHRIVPPWPHLFDDICVGFCNFPLHAQRVSEVQLLQIQVHQEVLRQWRRVTQTLWEKMHTSFYEKPYRYFCKRCSWALTCKAEFMKQVLPRFVRPHSPGDPRYESSSAEFRLETQNSILIPNIQ